VPLVKIIVVMPASLSRLLSVVGSLKAKEIGRAVPLTPLTSVLDGENQ
jgi:hypothetical protein